MIQRLFDFFDSLYPTLKGYSHFPLQHLICRVILSIIYHLNNMLCWWYHNIEKKIVPAPEDADYVISLTTYPARINNVWKVIEMMFHQRGIKEKYGVYLSLISEEFEGVELPKEILELQKRGLAIRFNNVNLRCHNKYYYAFKEFPDKVVCTVDDDLQYNHNTITALVRMHKQYPEYVIYNWGNLISKDSFASFGAWQRITDKGMPRMDVCPAGVGGVLYPPHSCDCQVLDINAIEKTCLCADDLWLSFMERVKGTKTVYSGLKSTFMILPDSSQENALYLSNVSEHGGNDKQIIQISNWSNSVFGFDFYVNV